ncbi:ABC transporter permease [Nevskia sp.]|uniref:ABC transporter permease n=1 Tax=Nevskia sp. TaxID=1929292 RepID=UPI0025D2577F|nr:ABC transporter permease [Nevskia sp.]
MKFLSQTLKLITINLKSVPARWGATLVIVVGLAGVVGVITALQSMSQGMVATLRATGSPDRAIVLRGGSNSELSSFFTRDQAIVIEQAPGVAKGADGKPLASGEIIVIAERKLRRSGTDSNVSMRGVGPAGFAMRPELKIVEGRAFQPGLQEIIVGKKAQEQFLGLEVGSKVQIRGSEWNVVGAFTSNGDAHESEAMVDIETAQSAFRRNGYSSLLVKLDDPAEFEAFKDSLTTDPRLQVDVQKEVEYFSAQSRNFTRTIGVLVSVVGVIMGLGAVFAALNTMYSAIAARTVEIATLRALGFGGGVVVLATIAEAMTLALIGGLIGGAGAYLFFNGYTVSTLGAGFTQVAFSFRVTPQLLANGLILSLFVGFLGGFFPALRAARMQIATALRAA